MLRFLQITLLGTLIRFPNTYFVFYSFFQCFNSAYVHSMCSFMLKLQWKHSSFIYPIDISFVEHDYSNGHKVSFVFRRVFRLDGVHSFTCIIMYSKQQHFNQSNPFILLSSIRFSRVLVGKNKWLGLGFSFIIAKPRYLLPSTLVLLPSIREPKPDRLITHFMYIMCMAVLSTELDISHEKPQTVGIK